MRPAGNTGVKFAGYLTVSHEGKVAKLWPDGRLTVTDVSGAEREVSAKPLPPQPRLPPRWHDPYG